MNTITLDVPPRHQHYVYEGEVWLREDTYTDLGKPKPPFDVRINFMNCDIHKPGYSEHIVATGRAVGVRVAVETKGGGRGRKTGERYVGLNLAVEWPIPDKMKAGA